MWKKLRPTDSSGGALQIIRNVSALTLRRIDDIVELHGHRQIGAPGKHQAQRSIALLRTSRDFIDTTWPNESLVAPPALFQTYYAIFSQQSQGTGIDNQPPSAIRIGPTPDGEHVTEFLGTFRPTPLSATNPITFISQFLPGLMLCNV